MKTVRRGSWVRRADDKTALDLVRNHNYSFCPKSVYKQAVVRGKQIHREIVEEE